MVLRKLLYGGLLLLACTMSWVSCTQEKGCDKDGDCGQGKICFNLICQNGCRTNDTCGIGQVCLESQCQKLSCLPGSARPCYGGTKGTETIGLCRPGRQYCNKEGEWDACSGQLLPLKEQCDRLDNDCNGKIDDGIGCECTAGQKRECFSGSPALVGKGECQKGSQSCGVDNKWGPCEGQILPLPEECDGKDNDCDGEIDQGLFCTCQPGDQRVCYGGPLKTLNVAGCKAGKQRCNDQGKWAECQNAVLPKVEVCDGKDNNCDGQIDEELSCPSLEGNTPDAGEPSLEFSGPDEPVRESVKEVPPEPKGPPTPKVIRATGGNSQAANEAFSVAVDADGNVTLVGFFSGRAQFDSLSLSTTATRAAFVAHQDASGQWLWVQKVGAMDAASESRASDVAVDTSGNIYVVGQFEGGARFSTLLTSQGGADAFVAKLDKKGNWLWSKQVGSTGTDEASSLALAKDQSVYVTGSFSGALLFGSASLNTPKGTDLFVAHIDPKGTWLEVYRASSDADLYGVGIAVGESVIAITGSFADKAAFGSHSLTTSKANEIFVAGLKSGAGWAWATSAAIDALSRGRDIVHTEKDVFAFTGQYSGTGTFAGGQSTSKGKEDIFVGTVNQVGALGWSAVTGSTEDDVGLGIQYEPNSKQILVTGRIAGDVSFGSIDVKHPLGGFALFVASLDLNGSWVWAWSQKSESTGGLRGRSLAFGLLDQNVGPTRAFYVAGQFDAPRVTFPNQPTLTTQSVNHFLAKLLLP